MIKRRSFITGLISLVAAPAIVRVASLMSIKEMGILGNGVYTGYTELIEGLKADGLFNRLDALYIFADNPSPLMNLVSGKRDLTYHPVDAEWRTNEEWNPSYDH